MKQEHGSKNCLAVCAAMAFKCKLREVENYFESSKKNGIAKFIDFGFHKGYHVGYVFIKPVILFGKIISTYDIKTFPALIIVESDYNKNETHALYWGASDSPANKMQVWDPNPGVDDARDLREYEIIGWYPIVELKKQ